MKLEVTTWSIIKVVLVLAGLWALWEIRSILALLFVVVILIAALEPSVEWLTKAKLPRSLAVTLVTIILLAGLALILAFIIPELVSQLQLFILDQFPALVSKLAPYYESIVKGQQLLTDILHQLQQLSGNVVSGILALFGGLLSALTVLVITFYALLETSPLQTLGLSLSPARYRSQILDSFERIIEKLGAWLRGQFLLSVIMAASVTIALSLIGAPAPLAVGILAGVLEIIPIIGPIITGAVMIVMALISPDAVLLKVLLTVAVYAILQFLENHIFVPRIMGKAIGLSPIVVIIALLVGSKLGGIGGAILAIPLAAIIQVVAQDWPKFKAQKAD